MNSCSELEEGEIADSSCVAVCIADKTDTSLKQGLEASSEDESAKEDTRQRVALPIADPAKFVQDTEPETGEEYLLMVCHERASLPKTLSVPVKSSAVKVNALLPPEMVQKPLVGISREQLPKPEFRTAYLEYFRSIRAFYSSYATGGHDLESLHLPNINDEKAWYGCLYSPALQRKSRIDPESHDRPCKDNAGSDHGALVDAEATAAINPDMVAAIDQDLAIRLLKYHCRKWLPGNAELPRLTPLQATWLITLLSRANPDQMSGEECFVLRSLSRYCRKVLCKDVEKGSVAVAGVSLHSFEAAIVIVISEIFGQRDLDFR